MSSVTVEALKKLALEAARRKVEVGGGAGAEEAILVSFSDEAATISPKVAEKKYPDVLDFGSDDTKMFSDLFGDLLPKGFTYEDFPVPVFDKWEYPPHMAAAVPKSSDYKSDPTLLYDAVLAFACGSVTHLVGFPGTGKSNGLPVLIASRVHLPMLRLGLNKKGMMLEDLIGREAIKSDGAGTMHTGHRDGVLLSWITEPCLVLADEFCRANVEITNGLMSLMERNGCMVVENRATPVITRHPHCWILASDNVKGLGDRAGSMVGTDVIDGAVLDRFEITLEVDYLSKKEQLALVGGWFPGFPEDVAKKIVDFGVQIQDGYKKDQLPISFSPRTLKEVARYTCIHKGAKEAIRKVVVSKYAEEGDISAIHEMYRIAFGESFH